VEQRNITVSLLGRCHWPRCWLCWGADHHTHRKFDLSFLLADLIHSAIGDYRYSVKGGHGHSDRQYVHILHLHRAFDLTLGPVTYLFRYTGQVLGVSLTGAALQSILLTKLRERIQGPGAIDIIERIRFVVFRP
jgi:hypothetical protein